MPSNWITRLSLGFTDPDGSGSENERRKDLLKELRDRESETTPGFKAAVEAAEDPAKLEELFKDASREDAESVLADHLGQMIPPTPMEVTSLLGRIAGEVGDDDLGVLCVDSGWDLPGQVQHEDFWLGRQEYQYSGHASIVFQAIASFLASITDVREHTCTITYVGFRPPDTVGEWANSFPSPARGLGMFCNRVWQSMDGLAATGEHAGKYFWAVLYCQRIVKAVDDEL